MNNFEVLNKLAIDVATGERQQSNGKVIRVNPNGTYDVKLDGSSTSLRNLKPMIQGENYYTGDTVIVSYPTGSRQLAVIAGKSNFEVPEEEEYEFEW